MPKLEEQLNEQTLKGTVSVNDQNLLQDLIQTVVLDDLNDVNISSPTDGQALGYQASTNSWQNVTVALPNDSVTNAKLANMATATVKGRATAGTGDPEDLAIDNDLSTVSASDDTIPSAKAVKAYVDILELKTRIRNGGLINGFIRVTVASNNLTVAISTSSSSQVDPTSANPVYVWIGDTLRSITGALSISTNAGTNWFNSGSSELATREIDYFAYIGYNATDGVVLGFARIPYARLYSNFNTTTTNEKYARISTITNAAAGDNYVNIGRFAATLSATASFNWSVPTFTNANLIQEPIYESRWLGWTPTLTGFSVLPAGTIANYKITNPDVNLIFRTSGAAGTSNATTFTVTAPMAAIVIVFLGYAHVINNGTGVVGGCRIESNNIINMTNGENSSGFTASGGKGIISATLHYRIN
jgi:hypothetical protein